MHGVPAFGTPVEERMDLLSVVRSLITVLRPAEPASAATLTRHPLAPSPALLSRTTR